MNGHHGARAGQWNDRLPTLTTQTTEHDAHAVSYGEVVLQKTGSKVWGAKFQQGRERLVSSWRRSRAVCVPLTPAVDIAEAKEFIQGFHAENPAAGDLQERLAQVRASVSLTGTYEHTFPELQWATRVAWRHAARCSGRDKWRTLRVRDRRTVSDPQEVAAETIAHLREATGGGRIRSCITVFAPDTPERPGPRILNPQAVR
jgi:hypothetical protein